MLATKPERKPRRASTFDQTASAFSTLASSMVTAIEDFLDDVAPAGERRTARRSCACGRASCRCGDGCCPKCGSARCGKDLDRCAEECAPCPPPSCECVCCVGDVDLVVYTRLGERRVVPIEIHNPRRRERELSIELTEFTTRGGKPADVTAVLVGGGRVTLGPCATHELTLVTQVGIGGERTEADLLRQREAGPIPDVDECTVVVAELRLVGCDMRSQRIALAILPRRCGAHEVECRYGCC